MFNHQVRQSRHQFWNHLQVQHALETVLWLHPLNQPASVSYLSSITCTRLSTFSDSLVVLSCEMEKELLFCSTPILFFSLICWSMLFFRSFSPPFPLHLSLFLTCLQDYAAMISTLLRNVTTNVIFPHHQRGEMTDVIMAVLHYKNSQWLETPKWGPSHNIFKDEHLDQVYI